MFSVFHCLATMHLKNKRSGPGCGGVTRLTPQGLPTPASSRGLCLSARLFPAASVCQMRRGALLDIGSEKRGGRGADWNGPRSECTCRCRRSDPASQSGDKPSSKVKPQCRAPGSMLLRHWLLLSQIDLIKE